MEIQTKNDHTKEEGIYKVAKRVKSYSQIRKDAEGMIAYFDSKDGDFFIDYKSGYALSHCQMDVGRDPYAFFILNSDFLRINQSKRTKRDNKKNFFYPSRVIVNPKVLEAPDKIEVNFPERKLVREGNKVATKIQITPKMESNKIGLTEGCFSFPRRTPKTVERYYRIKVRYQYPVKLLGLFTVLWRKTEWIEGLKAHIFQHETDHANAINIYYAKD